MKSYWGGMIDGDGVIYMHIRKRSGYKTGYQALPMIEIKEYFGGFTDADGCITMSTRKVKKWTKHGYNCYPLVTYTNYVQGDLIERFKDLCENIEANYCISKNDKLIRFQVQGIKNVKNFLIAIRPYLSIKKVQADIVLEKIIPYMETKKHLTRNGFIQLMGYADELASFHGGSGKRIYTKQFFENLWKNWKENPKQKIYACAKTCVRFKDIQCKVGQEFNYLIHNRKIDIPHKMPICIGYLFKRGRILGSRADD